MSKTTVASIPAWECETTEEHGLGFRVYRHEANEALVEAPLFARRDSLRKGPRNPGMSARKLPYL